MRKLIPKIANNRSFSQLSILIGILVSIAFCSEIDPGKEIKEKILMVHKTMSTHAASPDIASMNLDSANQLFAAILEKSNFLNILMRINSTGTIINETSREKSSNPYRSVASQKWFEQVLKSHKNYYGTNREDNGEISLFWAYPLFSQSKQFAGVLTGKINLLTLLKSGTDLSSLSYKLYFKEMLIYQNNWTETDSSNVTITQWGLSGDSLFKCISISQKNMENQVVNEGKPVISPPAVLDISHLEMNTKKGSKSHGLLLRIIILLSAVAGVILFIAVKKKRVINNHSTYDISNSVQDETEKDEKEVMDTVIPESIETPEDVPEESDLQESQPTESTDQNPLSLSETALSSMEDAYAKIKEIVYNDAVRHFKPVSLLELPSEEDYKVQLLRKKLYREIHGEILQWVVFESNRLTKSLEALTLKVDTLAHLQEPELNLIKDEINKISRNVENFKKLGLGRNKEFFPEA